MTGVEYIVKTNKYIADEAAKPERAGQIAVVSWHTGLDFRHIGPNGKWDSAVELPCQVVDIQGSAKVAWLDNPTFIRHLAHSLLEMIGEEE